jgi:hypothetical protein
MLIAYFGKTSTFKEMDAYLKRNRKYSAIIFLSIFVISLGFAIYTKHAWEDWYITYRCSKNLASGNGLVYTAGQKVHAFTSPLGTLIPAALSAITLNSSDELVLWLFRIISILLLGLSAVLLFIIARQKKFNAFAIIFLLSMFGTNINIIDFSINGMETAFTVFFLISSIYAMTISSRYTVLKLGLAWAGLMWTRPDAFIYIGGLSLGYLLFNPGLPNVNSRKELIKLYLKAGVVCTALYLPWILWARHYYGSFIPHPVLAKGLYEFSNYVAYFRSSFEIIGFLLIPEKSLSATFMPPNFYFGDWYGNYWGNLGFIYSQPLALLCAFYWILPFARPSARAVSFTLMIAHIYLSFIAGVFPWYMPSVVLLSIFVLAQIIQQVRNTNFYKKARALRITIYAIASLVFVINLSLTLASSYQLRLQQEIIENGNRKQIGLWLKEHAASSKDTVFLEPLGYIGYFSQLKMYDYPGLSSPEVIAARKKLGPQNRNFAELISELKPDWLVLRPHEIRDIHNEAPDLLTESYRISAVFDVSKKVKSYRFIPGRTYLLCDQYFAIFKIRK